MKLLMFFCSIDFFKFIKYIELVKYISSRIYITSFIFYFELNSYKTAKEDLFIVIDEIIMQDEQGLVAHEFLIDCKEFKKTSGVDVVDISKRLMDYG